MRSGPPPLPPFSRAFRVRLTLIPPTTRTPAAAIAFSPKGELWAAAGAVVGGQPRVLLSASRVAGGAAEPVSLPQGMLDALLGAGHDDAAAAEALRAVARAAKLSLRKRKYDSSDVVRAEGRRTSPLCDGRQCATACCR